MSRRRKVIESARGEAVAVLLDRRFFSLRPDRYDAFVRVLDHAPEPGPKLRKLLQRVPAWER